MAKPLPYQEEIEYTRALDDQVSKATHIPDKLIPDLILNLTLASTIGWQFLLAAQSVAIPERDLLPADGEVREEQAVVLLRPDGGKRDRV